MNACDPSCWRCAVAVPRWRLRVPRAADLRNFDDAALHAVQFVDRDEGWAVGDEGVVWHTIDGGRTWERQPTGVAGLAAFAALPQPVHGWVVGREELPHGAGSVGVLLFTQDGGLKWQRARHQHLARA